MASRRSRRAARRRQQRLRAAKRLRAKPKATAQDFDNLEQTVAEAISEVFPGVDTPQILAAREPKEYEPQNPVMFLKGMSPVQSQQYSTKKGTIVPDVTFKGKDIEEMRMRKLLNRRSKDEAAMLKFQKLRKGIEVPEELHYSTKSKFNPYNFGSYAGQGGDEISRSRVRYPGPESELMAHETGHAMEGKPKKNYLQNLVTGATNVPKEMDVTKMAYKRLFKIAPDRVDATIVELNKLPERRQYSIGPLKMAWSNLYGTIPVSKKEFDKMKSKVSWRDILNEARKMTSWGSAMIGNQASYPVINFINDVLEEDLMNILEGKGESFKEFMTYSKTDKEPQSSRQLAATQLSSKQDKA